MAVDPAVNSTVDSAIDVSGIVANFNRANASLNASKTDLENSQKIGVDAQAALEQSIKDSADAQAKVNEIDAQANAKRQATIAGSTAAIGTNPEAASYLVTSLGESIVQGEKDLEGRHKMIQQKMDTPFLSDPVGWVVNQFTLPYDVAAYNNKALGVNRQESKLGAILKLTSEAGTAAAVVSEADALTRNAAINEKLYADARATVDKSRLEIARFGLQVVTTRDALTKTQFDAVLGLHNAQIANANLVINKDANERAEARFQDIEKPQLKISQDQLQLNREQVLIAFERLGLEREAGERALEQLGINKAQLKISQDQEALIQRRYKEIELPTMQLRKEEAVRQQAQLELAQTAEKRQMDAFIFHKDETLEALSFARDRNERERRMTDLTAGEIIERMSLARAHLSLAQRSALLDDQIKQITINAKEDNDQAIKLLEAKLYQTGTTLGLQPPSYLQYKNMSQALRTKWETLMSDPAIDQGRMGSTPVDAMNNIQGVTNKLPGQMDAVRGELQNIRAALAKDAQWHGLKPDEQNMRWQGKINDYVKRETDTVRDQGSLFSPPPISVLMKTPLVANSVIGKSLGAIAGADSLAPLKAQDVVTIAADKVRKGEMLPAQAAEEISNIYKTVLDENNARFNYIRWSIIPPSGYNAAIRQRDPTSNFGAAINLNLADKAKVENFLLRQRAPGAFTGTLGGGASIPTAPETEGRE
jgi:hypothetical protein